MLPGDLALPQLVGLYSALPATIRGMQEHSPSRLPVLVAVVIVVLVLPVLYVLSIGPVQWLMGNGYIGEQSRLAIALGFFYWPIIAMHESGEPIRWAIDWYLAFWE